MVKDLKKFSEEEWEAVCSHCGKCCLLKLEDEDSGDVYFTDVVCRYFDEEKCCCGIYGERCEIVPECLKLDKDNVDKIGWMPDSCAYRRLVENRPQALCKSIKGRCVSEALISEDELENHIVDWEDL